MSIFTRLITFQTPLVNLQQGEKMYSLLQIIVKHHRCILLKQIYFNEQHLNHYVKL
jgi:hypothetical protein